MLDIIAPIAAPPPTALYLINLYYRLKKSFEKYAVEKEWKLHQGFSQHFPGGIKLSQCNAAWAVLAKKEHEISKI